MYSRDQEEQELATLESMDTGDVCDDCGGEFDGECCHSGMERYYRLRSTVREYGSTC